MSHEIAVADKTTPDAEPQLPQQALAQWTATVATHLPHLTPPQAVVLALWSFGMVMVQSCGLTTVAGFLGTLLGQKESTLR